MFFGKKSKKSKIECESCGTAIDKNYSFCPHCGDSIIDLEEEAKDFGMLGRSNSSRDMLGNSGMEGFGIMDKMLSSVMNQLTKNLEKQLGNMGDIKNGSNNTRIEALPNGLKISIGPSIKPTKPKKTKSNEVQKNITDEQLGRMAGLPRVPAKTSMKRFGDKIIYELSAPGIKSPEDIFVSKLESGYEIKAIAEKKVYVNSLPLELPLNALALTENKLIIEFGPQEG